MNTEIAEKIKNMLVENLRIPADELEYTSELFGDDIGLASGRATAFRNLPIPVRHTQLNP